MVDVDRRSALSHSHMAGLRRLSARANGVVGPSTPGRKGLASFSDLAGKVIGHLEASGVPVQPGLTAEEFARTEAELGFTFPPDLQAVLHCGLPVGPGFPDWRSGGPLQLKMAMELPMAGISYQVATGAFWLKSWGIRPTDQELAVRTARISLKKAPVLIPLVGHCYIPVTPCLAGNPVFSVDQTGVSLCGIDLADFFHRESAYRFPEHGFGRRTSASGRREVPKRESSDSCSSLEGRYSRRRSSNRQESVQGPTPRWIEFWSELVDPRRYSALGSSEPLFSSFKIDHEIAGRPDEQPAPQWVNEYFWKLSDILRDGGWEEADIDEVFRESPLASPGGLPPAKCAFFDSQTILEGLLLNADSLAHSLRRAGWSSGDVSDALCFEFQLSEPRKPAKNLPPEFAKKIVRLAECVAMS